MIKEMLQAFEEKVKETQQYPHVDLNSGKIYNCEKGTKAWWHEKGHIEFDNLPLTSSLKLWQGIFEFVWMICVSFAFFYKSAAYMAVFLILLYVIIELYEEYWCNKYARIKMKEQEK